MHFASLSAHIAAGAVAILAGFVALYVTKGATVHRKSGMLFVYTMTVMSLMGVTMAAVRNVAPAANVPVGLLTAYLVITALITVRPFSRSRWVDPSLMLVALLVGLIDVTFGFVALTTPTGKLYALPAFPFFLFGGVGLLASIGDLRLLRSGGIQVIRGAPRLARHLWRMSFALALAAFSFFLGQAKVIPKPIRIYPLLALPVVAVLVTMFYWLWRVRVRRTYRFDHALRPRADRSLVATGD